MADISRGSVGTLARRARSRSERLVVVSVPFGRAGEGQLLELARERTPEELLLILQLPSTPQPGESGAARGRYLRQPAIAIADGSRGSPRSSSTRCDGLVSSIDVAPTVLEWLGVEPPDSMRGARIEAGSR